MSFEILLKKGYKSRQKTLGHGSFGIVRLYQKQNVAYAIKKIQISEFQQLEEIQQVINTLLIKQAHPNVLKFFEIIKNVESKQIFVVMQYVQGVNFNKIKDLSTVQEKYEIIIGILQGIAFLHKKNIIHRDLKPGNILFQRRQNKFIPKVADFGISKIFQNNEFYRTQSVGAQNYMAPEIKSGQGYQFTIDIWSFGVLAYELLTNNNPFVGVQNDKKLQIGQTLPALKRIFKNIFIRKSMRYNCQALLKQLKIALNQQQKQIIYESLQQKSQIQLEEETIDKNQMDQNYGYDKSNYIQHQEQIKKYEQQNKKYIEQLQKWKQQRSYYQMQLIKFKQQKQKFENLNQFLYQKVNQLQSQYSNSLINQEHLQKMLLNKNQQIKSYTQKNQQLQTQYQKFTQSMLQSLINQNHQYILQSNVDPTWQIKIQDIIDQIKAQLVPNKQYQLLFDQLEDFKNKFNELQNQNQKLKTELRLSKIEETNRQQIDQYKKQMALNDIKAQKQIVVSKYNDLFARNQYLQQRLLSQQNELKQHENRNNELQNRINQQQLMIENSRNRQDSQLISNDEYNSKIQQLQKKIEILQNQMTNLNKKLTKQLQKYQKKEQQLFQIKKNNKYLQQQLSKQKNYVISLELDNRYLVINDQILKNQIKKVMEDKDKLKLVHKQQEINKNKFKQIVLTKDKQLQKLKQKCIKLQQKFEKTLKINKIRQTQLQTNIRIHKSNIQIQQHIAQIQSHSVQTQKPKLNQQQINHQNQIVPHTEQSQLKQQIQNQNFTEKHQQKNQRFIETEQQKNQQQLKLITSDQILKKQQNLISQDHIIYNISEIQIRQPIQQNNNQKSLQQNVIIPSIDNHQHNVQYENTQQVHNQTLQNNQIALIQQLQKSSYQQNNDSNEKIVNNKQEIEQQYKITDTNEQR